MASKISVNLDTSKENYLVAKCKQDDDLTLEAMIYENGLALDLTNKEIFIKALKADNTYINQSTAITKSNNKIVVKLIRDFSRVAGTTKIEILLVEGGKNNTTFSFYLEVVGSVIKGAIESKDKITILEELDNKVIEAKKVKEDTQTFIQNGGAATKGDIAQVNSSLEQIDNEVKKPITLNKCDSEMLGAIQNKQGETTFNLLSIPRDKSVTVEKTDFINNCLNLFNKESNENLEGKTIRTADGAIVSGGANDFVSHRIPIQIGNEYILTFVSPSYQNNILRGTITYITYNKELEKQSFGEISSTTSDDLIFTSNIDGYIVFKQSISNYDNLMFINATKFKNDFIPVTSLVGKSYTVPKAYENYKIEVENLKVGYLEDDVTNIKSSLIDINKNFNDLDLNYNPAKIKNEYYKTDKTKVSIITSSVTSSLTGKIYRAYENGIKKDTFTYSTRLEDMAIDANYLYQKDNLMYWTEFMFDGVSFEVASYSNSTNFVVIADDVIVTDKISVLGSGGLVYTGVTFNERKIRKIRICFRGSFRFYGIKTDTTGTIFPYNDKRPFCVYDGDSITEGTGSNQPLVDGYIGVVSKILNWKPINLAYGGTGFVNPGSGGRVPIGQRLDNVVSKNPDIFMVCCGLNDCGQEQYFNLTQQAIKDYFANVKAKLKCEIIVLSPFSPNENGNVTNLQTVNNWVRENALLNNFPFIDTINGETYDKNGNKIAYGWGGLITGTGKVGATTGDGNRDIYITNDGTHPTSDGHIAKGYRVAEEVYRIYNN